MRVGEKEYWEAVTGRVIDKESGKPLRGVTVRAYDKDVMVDDHLGEAVTDGKGRFRIEFAQSKYMAVVSMTEGRPDIYLKLEHPDGRSAKTPVHYDMEGKMEPSKHPVKGGPDGEIEVMKLGDVEL